MVACFRQSDNEDKFLSWNEEAVRLFGGENRPYALHEVKWAYVVYVPTFILH